MRRIGYLALDLKCERSPRASLKRGATLLQEGVDSFTYVGTVEDLFAEGSYERHGVVLLHRSRGRQACRMAEMEWLEYWASVVASSCARSRLDSASTYSSMSPRFSAFWAEMISPNRQSQSAFGWPTIIRSLASVLPAGKPPIFTSGYLRFGAGCSDAKVAGDGELESASEAVSVDGSDGWFAQCRDFLHKFVLELLLGGEVVTAVEEAGEFLDVVAHGEVVAGAGDDDCPYIVALVDVGECTA